MARFFHYFAYGTDMHPLQPGVRNLGGTVLGPASLVRHSLRFHRRSDVPTDGSGKCNAFRTGRASDVVHGVLYQVHEQHRVRLADLHPEDGGCRVGTVRVALGPDTSEAAIHVADPDWIDETLLPYDWYVAVIGSAARIHGLPTAYQARLRTVTTVADADRERSARYFEMAQGSRKIRAFFRAPRA